MTIPFEISDRPWFGPRKRAAELLAHRTHVLPPQEAVMKFHSILGVVADRIRLVRFIDYVHSQKHPFRYTIAIVWLGPDPEARDAVYEQAEEVVRTTGWYLLPQGERISSREAERQFRRHMGPAIPRDLRLRLGGKLQAIESAVGQDGGCSIRVRTDEGSLILDTGLPGALVADPTDRVVLLSHGHLDHCGGIVNKACDSLRVVTSTATARLLAATRRINTHWLRRRAFFLDAGQDLQLGGVTISAFAVPHCPGSVGYIIRGANRAVIFSGDIALESSRHDFLPRLSAIVSALAQNHNIVLMDATMVGRRHGVTKAETAVELLDSLSDHEDMVLVSDEVEQLLYAFLDLFHTAKSKPTTRSGIEFIASTKLRPVFEVIHSAFMARQLDMLDPFLDAQYGKSMSAWAETRWLYWLDRDLRLASGSRYKRIWFITKDEIGLVLRRGKIGVISIGRSYREAVASLLEADVLDLDSAVWTLHSNEASLIKAIKHLQATCEIVLFHNFAKRIRRFSKENDLSCRALSRAAVSISGRFPP